MIDSSGLPFPKPRKGRRRTDPQPFRVMPDGREICSAQHAGRVEYRRRTLAMLERRGGRCCLEGWCPFCPGALSEEECSFDHEHGRGTDGHKRDDRIVLPDGTWQNGAAHILCNGWKSSRYIPYNQPSKPATAPLTDQDYTDLPF